MELLVAKRLSSKKIESVAWVQILNETAFLFASMSLRKDKNQYILSTHHYR